MAIQTDYLDYDHFGLLSRNKSVESSILRMAQELKSKAVEISKR